MFMAICTLIFIHFCALVTPGPDLFLVSQTAMSKPIKETLLVVCGICFGAIIWAALALLGLSYIFEKLIWLKTVLFVFGGLYLLWMGIQMLRSALSKTQQQNIIDLPNSKFLFFIKGLLTNLSNPKAIIYFGSIFSLFLANPVLKDVHFLLFIIVIIETSLWFLFVGFVFSMPRIKQAYHRAAKWIDGISGGIFTLFGIYLLGHR